jgi:hypothetical protein
MLQPGGPLSTKRGRNFDYVSSDYDENVNFGALLNRIQTSAMDDSSSSATALIFVNITPSSTTREFNLYVSLCGSPFAQSYPFKVL